MEVTLSIDNGSLQFICCDLLEPLLREGNATVRRVSHVEWDDERQGWCADMSPVGGETLGAGCGWTREEALNAEHNWLVENRNL